jgi:hypothetical protein
MATEELGKRITRVAAADLSARQFTFVIIDANGQVAAPGAAAAMVIGILQNKPTAGQAADVALISGGGVSKLVGDGTIAAGERVGVLSATGKGRQAATSDYVCGVALTTSAVDGGIIEILLGAQALEP